MSTRELFQVLQPRKFEPQFERDLVIIFNKAKNTSVAKIAPDAARAIRTGVFKSFLAGKLQATREYKQFHDYSIGDYDLQIIQQLRGRYISDFSHILSRLRWAVHESTVQQDEAGLRRRLSALASSAVWQSYNLGKLSTFRQRAEGKLGFDEAAMRGAQFIYEPLVPANTYQQPVIDERVFWITEAGACELCLQYEATSFQIGGWSVFDDRIPSIPFDSHPFCRCEYQTSTE